MDNFGDQLRQERERRNVALDDIARLTKIRVRYLQALEDGQHERLPGIVFAKGYVRAYAETIGADAERLVGAYVAEQRSLGRLETEASQENVLEALAAAVEDDKDRASKRGKAALVVSVVLLAALAAFWFGVRPLMDGEPAVATNTPTPAAAVPEQPTSPETAVVDTSDANGLAVEPGPADEPSAGEVEVAQARPRGDETTANDDPSGDEATLPQVLDNVEAKPAPAEREPAPTIETATIDAPAGSLETLSVSEYGVGTDVQRRVLIGEASEFETGTMVVFWNRVLGGEPGRHIRHVWFHEGNVNGTRQLSIGAAHWRTYSKQTLRRDGNWTVEAQDENGRVLARQTFVATARKL